MARNNNIQLLVIDPQNDFCDLPADWTPAHSSNSRAPAGRAAPSLPVAGAHADLQRLAAFIRAQAGRLTGISVGKGPSQHRLNTEH